MKPPTESEAGFLELANSIDRSRKRHLEVGLLRGDQVHDRLGEQEASASPILKRLRQTPEVSPPAKAANMAMTMAEFKDYMDNNTNKRLDGLDGKMSGMQASISRIDSTVRDNSERIQRHESQINEMREEVKKMKDGSFPPLPTANRDLGMGLIAAPPTPASDPEYTLARRSLRLWPVEGATRDQIWAEAGIFMGTRLGLEGKIDKTSIESITRVEIPSGPGVCREVLVSFRDNASRDLVMGAASKLGPYIDSEGKATAGMRMEVPPRLQQNFRVLFKYGQTLRARHGKGTRRHVKFCDVERNLYLNVKLPLDETWSRVSLEVALRGMRARNSLNDDQLEKRLDITGPIQPRERAASTSGRPAPTLASAWTRRSGGSASS